MAAVADRFSIEEFLAQEREKDLLRFSTAGSVDDGKSTLIGRLLYDTQSVYDDQVRSIEGKGTTAPGQLDFALLTDGLRAEREQGITIDVAYRYFSTPRRKFIIADTPGHEQYTRNMATGSSTADATIVLIDAGKGVLVQSRRHAYIASLLRVRHLIVAVNKMDLIGYDEAAFRAIERDFRSVLDKIAEDTGNPVEAVFVPVSALKGDNIVHRAAETSGAMPWYSGPSLLELLESLPPSLDTTQSAFRFPVQRVVRPDHTFRGFAGQIASGTVRPGDEITVLPSGRSAVIERIVTWDGELEEAQAPLSVTLVLDRELDISRGDLITAADEPGRFTNHLKASVVWMDQRPLQLHRRYLLKHASHLVPAVVASIDYRSNVATLEHEAATTLEMNAIGVVNLVLLRPAAFDRYALNRTTGAFILIDAETNGTVAAGMVTATAHASDTEENLDTGTWGPVTAGEREGRWGHRGAVLELAGPASLIDSIERSLFTVGVISIRLDRESESFRSDPSLLAAVLGLQTRAGFLALVTRAGDDDGILVAKIEGQEIFLESGETMKAVSAIHQLLHRTGVFPSTEQAGF
ncbi:sulfate adenylyltransferase subunit CysN [Acidobacteria bacterium AB60]|nr:sulfate adenylyltransferase subunit CysN [Acidobacteria bacterium AB60]